MANTISWGVFLIIVVIVVTYGALFLAVGYSCGYRTAKEEERKKELRKKGIIK